MFTPLNVKKLTNVSVVTLKKFGKRYEVAIYPNKLYEYQKKITTNLEEIVQHQTIFRNVSKGEVCSKGDLELFNKPVPEIIREILERGHEQKNEATRNKEVEMAEKEIVDLVRKKVTKNGKFLSYEAMKNVIHSKFKISINTKKQAQEIVSKLEKEGYERINYKIECEEEVDFQGLIYRDGEVLISSRDLPEFKKHCKERNIQFVVHQPKEEEESEEIE
ncbi:Ribosome maturation protein SDO1 [Nosema granulosis]|uniref:Ribosome maturation protein SDO1 n=1 Tax=Nosema granulosis TaxID=83296 RepID=A0A9P6H0A1_9MICR|nr:Ribosome maturation protein SDO1 [Nosema granulosis]